MSQQAIEELIKQNWYLMGAIGTVFVILVAGATKVWKYLTKEAKEHSNLLSSHNELLKQNIATNRELKDAVMMSIRKTTKR